MSREETARTSSIFALPVSVEQVATVIKQMSPADRQRLLALVPELQRAVKEEPARTVEEARAPACAGHADRAVEASTHGGVAGSWWRAAVT